MKNSRMKIERRILKMSEENQENKQDVKEEIKQEENVELTKT